MTGDTSGNEKGEVRTLIYGSCVSRDTFKSLPDDYRLLTYVARQSAISAGAPAAGVRQRLRDLPSAFQNRMVAGDVRGDLHDVLDRRADDVDLVLVDLIDERGGVIAIGGGFVTKLSEFWSAGGREATSGLPVIELGTDAHFELWSRGFDAIVDHLDRLDLTRRTVVLRTPWASLDPEGEPIPIPDWMTPPAVADARYERYFAHVAARGLAMVELPTELARSPRDHPWGPSPFHYTEQAYQHLAAGITAAASAKRTRSTP